MTREEKIKETFNTNFDKYKNKSIVIFGTGKYARWLIDNFKDYNFVGFLDRWASNGEIYGKELLSYRTVIEKKVEIIIIAASKNNTSIIATRIVGFCNDNNIKVFSLEGELLSDVEEKEKRFSASSTITESDTRYTNCKNEIETEEDQIYWKLIEEKYLKGDYYIDKLGRLHITEPYDIGFLLLGPIVTDLMRWIVDYISTNHSQKIIFSARDGYLPNQIYFWLNQSGMFQNLPDSLYLLTSRYVCMLSDIYTEDDIIDCSQIYFEGGVEELMYKRFLLKREEVIHYQKTEHTSDVDYILLHKKVILEKAKYIRDNYIKYVHGMDMLSEKEICFFDLAATGTCQRKIEEILQKDLVGLYFLRLPTTNEKKLQMKINSYCDYNGELADHTMFMEGIMTSFMPTLQYVDQMLSPHYSDETRNRNELIFIRQAQNGIVDYFKQSMLQFSQRGYRQSRMPLVLFEHLTSYHTIIDNKVFQNYYLFDEIQNQNNSMMNKCMV